MSDSGNDNDERTVIVKRAHPEVRQPAAPPQHKPQLDLPESKKPDQQKAESAKFAEKPRKQAAKRQSQPPDEKPVQKPSQAPVIILSIFGLLLVGFGAALLVIFMLTPSKNPEVAVIDQDTNNQIVAVTDETTEAEDEALVKAALAPRIVSLSGDPVIVRQLATAPRQLVKLDRQNFVKEAADLSLTSDVYRFRDVLDIPSQGLASGIAGSQEDIAALQEGGPEQNLDQTTGATIVSANLSIQAGIREFAQDVKAKTGIAEFLGTLGLSADRSKLVETAFTKFYGRSKLQKSDKVAVRAVSEGAKDNALNPVQISVYADDNLIGSVAVDDLDAFAQAADPWAGQDIFRTELLPTSMKPEDRPRLLDAIYAAALRNRIPAAVTGEAIILLSRAQDLEQKVQDGDTISLIYSPSARDAKTGMGRVVYIAINRITGSMECYAFQAKSGAQFECLTADGASNVPVGGMVTPVNGVIVARFGPEEQASGEEKMNFGVDWTAPEGSPVIAVFDGEVTSAGDDPTFGKVLRLDHGEGKNTMYGYLLRFAPSVAAGAKIKAGQVIGYVGIPASSREPRLHFELRKNDIPVDPVPELRSSSGLDVGTSSGVSIGGSNVVDQFVHRIITIESANRCNASNPLSTAVGLGQFIESTWMTTVRIHRPDLLAGRSRQQVLDLRLDCGISREMTTAFTRDNAAVIRRAGHSVTPGNLYLAHFLGVGGAVKTLSGDQGRQIEDVFGSGHVRANPFERGKSLGYLVAWAEKKMGSAPRSPPPTPKTQLAGAKTGAIYPPVAGVASAANEDDQEYTPSKSSAAPTNVAFTRYDNNPAFTKLKSAVIALLR